MSILAQMKPNCCMVRPERSTSQASPIYLTDPALTDATVRSRQLSPNSNRNYDHVMQAMQIPDQAKSSQIISPQFLDARMKTILITIQTKMVSQMSSTDRSIPSTQSKGKEKKHIQYDFSNMAYTRNMRETEIEKQLKEEKIKNDIFSFSAAFNTNLYIQLFAAFGT
ncbi:MAG: hypothetical protein EZS28_029208 [Streblomastix strix]|uniref:Uncharacterized protein n=1 Tax=Streblomastix strix TaxID=222440 RepID=A0A5J4UX27_9EUKA|nr:MAG: hypothetical protein EZS28_029208 [Streblomastix strix]